MARPRNISDEGVKTGPIDEWQFKVFLKKLDLAQVEVEEKAEDVKTARSELSALWKEFKKAGGKPDTMREVMRMRTMDEGDLIQHEADRQAYAAWMKLPIGTQPNLFGEDPPRKLKTAAPAVENKTGSPLN